MWVIHRRARVARTHTGVVVEQRGEHGVHKTVAVVVLHIDASVLVFQRVWQWNVRAALLREGDDFVAQDTQESALVHHPPAAALQELVHGFFNGSPHFVVFCRDVCARVNVHPRVLLHAARVERVHKPSAITVFAFNARGPRRTANLGHRLFVSGAFFHHIHVEMEAHLVRLRLLLKISNGGRAHALFENCGVLCWRRQRDNCVAGNAIVRLFPHFNRYLGLNGLVWLGCSEPLVFVPRCLHGLGLGLGLGIGEPLCLCILKLFF